MMQQHNITSLKAKLIHTINENGPLTISQFMSLCLSDAHYGYYKTAEPFGREGDFITAPEVSQMFGEMLAIWIILTWQALDKPNNFILCEMGPGRGTLMDDVLRTIKKLNVNCFKAADIYLIETSPKLRDSQKKRLQSYDKSITWQDHFSTIPPFPLILIANELFDCLPIHQYIFDGQNWHERMVSTTTTADNQQELIFCIGSIIAAPILPYALNDPIHQGTIIEVSPARENVMDAIANHLAHYRGAALIIDYGAIEPKPTDTLQAMSKHRFSAPLANPGQDDLTSHVDFAALAYRAQQMQCQTYMTTQGNFLLNLGLIERAQILGHGRDGELQAKISQDVERLAGDHQMGSLFKVLCISDKKTTLLPLRNELMSSKSKGDPPNEH